MSLAVTRDDLLREIGRFLGWKRNPSEWDPRQQTDGADILRRGLSQFYYPAALPGENRAHSWACLRPIHNFATITNGDDYDLPEDFGGMLSDIYYIPGDVHPQIRKTTVDAILQMRQADLDNVGYPCWYAVSPMASTNNEQQRWTLMLHPKAQAAYQLRARYRVDPMNITGSARYPLGGPVMAEALLASCVAAADSVVNDNDLGPKYTAFIEKLRTAVYIDRQEHFSGNLGYNGDPGMEPPNDFLSLRPETSGFTINGESFAFGGFYT